MDQISIKNIFNTNNTHDSHTGALDVYSLYNPISVTTSLTVDKLITTKEKKRSVIKAQYIKIYNNVLEKINKADDKNCTHIIFNVPTIMVMCPDYKCKDCVEYINRHLKNLHMDVLLISDSSMFISWKNIENNIEKDKEGEDKEKDKD